jgi:ankyrin repeat protein
MTNKNRKLIHAIKTRNISYALELIEKGADINSRDKYGNTALMNASYEGLMPIVEKLINAGADVNAYDEENNYDALQYAVMKNHLDIVRVLLKAGANPNAQTVNGYTALMDAAMQGNIDILRTLLQAGVPNGRTRGAWQSTTEQVRANPFIRNYNGDSALDFSIRFKNKNIENYLRKYIERIIVEQITQQTVFKKRHRKTTLPIELLKSLINTLG